MRIFTREQTVDSDDILRFKAEGALLNAYPKCAPMVAIELTRGSCESAMQDFKHVCAGLISGTAYLYLPVPPVAPTAMNWHVGDNGILTQKIGSDSRFSAGCVVKVVTRDTAADILSVASMAGGNIATGYIVADGLSPDVLRFITESDLDVLRLRYEDSRHYPDYEGYAAACDTVIGEMVRIHCERCNQLILPVRRCPCCGTERGNSALPV